MNKSKLKKTECLKHREVQYEKALDGVMAGEIPPSYATERFNKLKQVRGGKQ